MRQDLLKRWLDTVGLECHTLERLSKRRRIDYPSEEEAASELPLPSVPPKAYSDHYRQASRSATNSRSKQTYDWEVHSCSGPIVHKHWVSKYINSAQHQEQEYLGLHFPHTINPINSRLRRSKSDSGLKGCKGCENSAIVQADYMSQSLEPSSSGLVAPVGGFTKPRLTVRTADTSSEWYTGSKQSRINATNTDHRSDVLALNRVIFRSATATLPVTVAAAVNKFVFKHGSSEIDNATATKIRDEIIQLEEDGETALRHRFINMGVLPSKAAGENLKRVQQLPFTDAILPRAIIPDGISVAIQPICVPKPDVAYGYTLQGFTDSQQITQKCTIDGVDLSNCSRLAKDLYWPFFVVEFEAPAMGGNIYVAENQCAGGVSASLLASQTLYTIASQAHDPADVTDSVAYSAATDGAGANLLIHWYEVGDGEYCLQRIRHYDLNRSEDIQSFQMHCKNIVDWGVGSRLEKIRAALDAIMAEEIKKEQLQTKRPGEPSSTPLS